MYSKKEASSECSVYGDLDIVLSRCPRAESAVPFRQYKRLPMYKNAIFGILRISEAFRTRILTFHFAFSLPSDILKLPSLVPKTSPLIWQIYLRKSNLDSRLQEIACLRIMHAGPRRRQSTQRDIRLVTFSHGYDPRVSQRPNDGVHILSRL
jgi:hypothetical protein